MKTHRPDRRDPAMRMYLTNGRRRDDNPPLAYQPVTGFPRLPEDGATMPLRRSTESPRLLQLVEQ